MSTVRHPRQATDEVKGPTVNDRETTVQQLIELMEAFVAERKWEPFHDPKNLSASIAIEAAELIANGSAKPLKYFPKGAVKKDYVLFENPLQYPAQKWKPYFIKAIEQLR